MKSVVFILLCLTALSSASAQNSEISLTVYNNNLGLVRDVRTLTLKSGVSEIKFQDVAAQIDPTSVYFNSLTAPKDVAILEQNYEFDLVSSAKIMQKYIDQEITLAAKDGAAYSGKLLSAGGGDVILQDTDGGIKVVSMNIVENISFPSLPEGLITRPTLVWKLDNKKSGEHKTEIGYLTHGLQWHAEYVGVANEKDTELELSAWVSIDNQSGASYKDAKLKLVAGDVHMAEEIHPPMYKTERMEVFAAADVGFQEKAFFEYHLYTLPRPATVADNQIKQISLFPSTRVAVTKKYAYEGWRHDAKVKVNLEFENKKSLGLGIPLPKGKARIYKQDDDESLVFIGEDFIDHTPKDEKVRVYVGDAFDIVAERNQTERKQIAKGAWEETWEIKLRNHKEESVEVIVVERLARNWEIVSKSQDFHKRDANTIEFKVAVPKDGETILKYTVRYANQ